MSFPSSATQIIDACGVPSGLTVITVAVSLPSNRRRALSGIAMELVAVMTAAGSGVDLLESRDDFLSKALDALDRHLERHVSPLDAEDEAVEAGIGVFLDPFADGVR